MKKTAKKKDPIAVELGRRGGLVRSAAKSAAARINGAKGAKARKKVAA